MPRPARPWFRVYVEITRDMKIRTLSPTYRWLWIAILAAARESPLPGKLMLTHDVLMNETALSQYADIRLDAVRRGLTELERFGLVSRDVTTGCLSVSRWSDRQYESDDVTVRTAKHRSNERGRNVPTTVVGTVVGTPPDTETDTETEELLAPPQKPATNKHPDLLFEAIAEACEIDWRRMTTSERGKLNTATKQIRDVSGSPDEIHRRACSYRARWPDMSLTPTALAAHWSELERDQPKQPKGNPAVIQETMRKLDVALAMPANGSQPIDTPALERET